MLGLRRKPSATVTLFGLLMRLAWLQKRCPLVGRLLAATRVVCLAGQRCGVSWWLRRLRGLCMPRAHSCLVSHWCRFAAGAGTRSFARVGCGVHLLWQLLLRGLVWIFFHKGLPVDGWRAAAGWWLILLRLLSRRVELPTCHVEIPHDGTHFCSLVADSKHLAGVHVECSERKMCLNLPCECSASRGTRRRQIAAFSWLSAPGMSCIDSTGGQETRAS